MNESETIQLVENDEWMMSVLGEAQKLNLPNWMIGAGFIRNKVWDHLHDIKRNVADTSDIDLIYFDPVNVSRENDKNLSKKMNGVLDLEWEIVNQAYTHEWHNRREPYRSSEEALSEWIETPTCVAVTLENGTPKIIAPHGIDDLVNLIIRPSPNATASGDVFAVFHNRITSKDWLKKWNKLKIVVD